MKKPKYRWDYIVIELEIGGKIVDKRLITMQSYQRMFKLFQTRAKAQFEEWFIYITYERNFANKLSRKLFSILNQTDKKELCLHGKK